MNVDLLTCQSNTAQTVLRPMRQTGNQPNDRYLRRLGLEQVTMHSPRSQVQYSTDRGNPAPKSLPSVFNIYRLLQSSYYRYCHLFSMYTGFHRHHITDIVICVQCIQASYYRYHDLCSFNVYSLSKASYYRYCHMCSMYTDLHRHHITDIAICVQCIQAFAGIILQILSSVFNVYRLSQASYYRYCCLFSMYTGFNRHHITDIVICVQCIKAFPGII